MPQRETFTVDEAAKILGIGRNSAFQAAARGDLPVIRMGRRLLVPRSALAQLLAQPRHVEEPRSAA